MTTTLIVIVALVLVFGLACVASLMWSVELAQGDDTQVRNAQGFSHTNAAHYYARGTVAATQGSLPGSPQGSYMHFHPPETPYSTTHDTSYLDVHENDTDYHATQAGLLNAVMHMQKQGNREVANLNNEPEYLTDLQMVPGKFACVWSQRTGVVLLLLWFR